MHIVLITPAPPGSMAGNRATAQRWAGLLEHEGHSVTIVTDFTGEYLQRHQGKHCDLVIALHAWRSHDAVAQVREALPHTPLIVVLTGTDIYHHQHHFPETTLETMDWADCLIGLHHRVVGDVPARYGRKLVTVLQSADQPLAPVPRNPDCFQVCVIGHLRDEKDSLRAALAAKLLPGNSRVEVINAGKPHTPEWEARAREEQAANPRFQWVGEIGKQEIQALMKRSHLMVISSIMEGGANVVSEACRAGLPILASDISGNIGLLGDDYPGYFKTGDERDLARLLSKAESSAEFVAELTHKVIERAVDFTPEAEQAALAAAIKMALAQRAALSRSE